MIPTLVFTIVRYLLGGLLVVFATNALFIKAFSPKIPPRGAVLMGAMKESGYLLYFVQGTELIIGLLLVTGYFIPAALIVLMPISINIFLFHLFLAPPIYGPGLFILAMNLFLLLPFSQQLSFFLIP